jgi:drug/metabolite transporter (DMT)-like permease
MAEAAAAASRAGSLRSNRRTKKSSERPVPAAICLTGILSLQCRFWGDYIVTSLAGRSATAAVFALLAFASNSVLCRMALRDASIDPASFTSVRLVTGALTLWLLVRMKTGNFRFGGDWRSAAALLIYAVGFSFAYVGVTTGTGALLLFGAVQLIMISTGLIAGERIRPKTAIGWALAASGVLLLLLPGVSAPPLREAAMMLWAGIAWGVYSLRGRRSKEPLCDTSGNFARAAPVALLISALWWPHRSWNASGVLYAALSGSLASGLGYAAWYAALPRMTVVAASNAQLSVPVIAAMAGVALFGEPISARLVVSSILVLGGIALAVRPSPGSASASRT